MCLFKLFALDERIFVHSLCCRFSLHQRLACPHTLQPFTSPPCIPGDPMTVYEGLYIEKVITGLAPYTAYEFQVQSVSEAGASDFPVWVRVETAADGTLSHAKPDIFMVV